MFGNAAQVRLDDFLPPGSWCRMFTPMVSGDADGPAIIDRASVNLLMK